MSRIQIDDLIPGLLLFSAVDPVTTGLEFRHVDNWGEQMTAVSQTVVVTFDLRAEEFNVWSSEDGILPSNVCPGKVTLSL